MLFLRFCLDFTCLQSFWYRNHFIRLYSHHQQQRTVLHHHQQRYHSWNWFCDRPRSYQCHLQRNHGLRFRNCSQHPHVHTESHRLFHFFHCQLHRVQLQQSARCPPESHRQGPSLHRVLNSIRTKHHRQDDLRRPNSKSCHFASGHQSVKHHRRRNPSHNSDFHFDHRVRHSRSIMQKNLARFVAVR